MTLNQSKIRLKTAPFLTKNGKLSKTRQNSTTAKTEIVVFGPSDFKKSPFYVQISCTRTKNPDFVFNFFFSRNLPILAILGPSTGNLYRKRTFFEKLRPKNGLFLNEIHEKS